MMFDSYGTRDMYAPDQLQADLVDATVPGNEQLVKGGAPAAVAILLELEVQTV